MGSISIQNVTRQFGGQVVLAGVSLELHSGEIVGIVGPNGSGKTTLLRLAAGLLPPDLGTVTRCRGLEVAYLAQDPQISLENTLHDEVLSAFAAVLELERKLQELSERMAAKHDSPQLAELMRQYDRVAAELTAAGGYSYEQRLNEILGGLGFGEADRRLPMRVLSGGQKCRAALAKLLLQDATYLLLDEPTNHLDIDAVRWLEKFLAGHHGGAAIVSHDRYLLDRLAARIVEVDRVQVASYPGNYSNYTHVRALRRLTQERQYEKDRALIEKERDFIARYHYAQRSKQARGRRKRLERRLESGELVLEKPAGQRDIRLDFNRGDPQSRRAVHRGERMVVGLKDVAMAFDDKPLFAGLALELDSGQRLGVTGPNGTGKTTLLRLIRGELSPAAGEITLDAQAAVGYYAQEVREVDSGATVLSEVLGVRPDFGEPEARSYLARFLFTGSDVFKPAASLSGGEQSRLRLAKLILTAPNVLILDEPTNHLDIPSREALEQALSEYAGTIIAVSHDRYFLDRIVQRLLVLRADGHTHVNGNYSAYVCQLEAEAQPQPRPAAPAVGARTPRKRARGERKEGVRERSRFQKLTLSELEAFITDHETRLRELQDRFADPAAYRDGPAVARLRSEFDARQRELAEAETEWERRIEGP